MNDQSLGAMHRRVAEQLGDRIAMRFKSSGCFRDYSWRLYRDQADRAAAGLAALGLQPGDRVGILSPNRYEWLVCDIAVLSAGCVDVPMHAPLSASQVHYQLSHSGARAVVVSDQSQWDKVAKVLEDLPDLEWIISFDPVSDDLGLSAKPEDSGVVSLHGGAKRRITWGGLLHTGRRAEGQGRAEVLRREAAVVPDDLATIIYTSGTTGNPKGVMLTHGNIISNAASTLPVGDVDENDVLLSWLPYSHIYARTVDHYLSVLAGSTLCLAESGETIIDDVAHTHPTWLTAVPRFYEKVWTLVEQLDAESRCSTLKRLFGPRLRRLCSGGAPLPRHVCEGFFEAGIPLLEGYGLTESSPVISYNRLDDHRIGTVGQAIPGVEVRIADDGEILTRGPHVMKGYWNNPEATAETIKDGWLYTGDVGFLDYDGYLTITDRKKDLIITSGGKNIAPSELERLLVSDPLIDQAVVYGDGKHFVTALIVPNFALLKERVCTDDVDGGGEFFDSDRVRDAVGERVDAVMTAVSSPERVKKFLVLRRPFSLADDELTATLKVRRRHVIDKYRSQLDELYE